jgi:hypothetical protein
MCYMILPRTAEDVKMTNDEAQMRRYCFPFSVVEWRGLAVGTET